MEGEREQNTYPSPLIKSFTHASFHFSFLLFLTAPCHACLLMNYHFCYQPSPPFLFHTPIINTPRKNCSTNVHLLFTIHSPPSQPFENYLAGSFTKLNPPSIMGTTSIKYFLARCTHIMAPKVLSATENEMETNALRFGLIVPTPFDD